MLRRTLMIGCGIVALLVCLAGVYVAGYASQRGSLPQIIPAAQAATTATVSSNLQPTTVSTNFVDCTANVSTRLHPGMNAIVAPVNGTMTRVRQTPRVEKNNWLFSVDEGKTIQVENENPQCDGAGRRWWKISTTQGSGFMAENDGTTYLIAPGQ